jgi:TusA-related sulfurtransferase
MNEPSAPLPPAAVAVPSTARPRPAPAHRPTLLGGTGDAVGFLDAPGVDAGTVLRTVAEVLAGMPTGGVLTVYTDDPTTAAAAGEWCTGRRAELMAIIRHQDHGTTLTFRCGEAPS